MNTPLRQQLTLRGFLRILCSGALTAILCGGCGTTMRYEADGSIRQTWAPPEFGKMLAEEVQRNPNYFKAAPQLESNRLVQKLGELIDRNVKFQIEDYLIPIEDSLGIRQWVFTSHKSPEIKPADERKITLKYGDKQTGFLVSLRVLRPIGIREADRHGSREKYPIVKTLSVQYRLVCSPDGPGQRVIVFHRQVVLEASAPKIP